MKGERGDLGETGLLGFDGVSALDGLPGLCRFLNIHILCSQSSYFRKSSQNL